jgi:peptidoglycan/xylan/chitin deacetylase (PgdA/CDA1 family)
MTPGPGPVGLILLYHRIAELTSDPQLLAVTPRHFAQHLEVLRDCGIPMSLPQMMSARRDRRLPHRAIAVTFDDGYADTLDCGESLLARHHVPATVFVTTSYIGAEREFWWDDLERLLLLPGRLPETLRLRIGQTVHEWRLDEAAIYDEETSRQHRGWTVECPADPSLRHSAYRALCRLLRTVPGDERRSALDELTRIAGATSTGRSTHRPVSHERLARACEGSLVDVGAHATTHSALSALSEAAQRSEIADSKARLQEITGREPAGFAYPFGGRADYARMTVALVREAGFAFACANIPAVVRPRSDRFQLPRVLVRDWDADTFAARLREWFGD